MCQCQTIIVKGVSKISISVSCKRGKAKCLPKIEVIKNHRFFVSKNGEYALSTANFSPWDYGSISNFDPRTIWSAPIISQCMTDSTLFLEESSPMLMGHPQKAPLGDSPYKNCRFLYDDLPRGAFWGCPISIGEFSAKTYGRPVINGSKQ